MAYSREDIIEKVREALKNPAVLYQAEVVKYIGDVDNEWYTEIAAQEILKAQNLSLLCDIPQITRRKSYKIGSHIELSKREKPEYSNRNEEWIAIAMFGKAYDCIGEILDFQTPLKDTADDTAGKIDLLSYNQSNNTAYILELKKPGSEEPLLRCALEAYTYWKIVDTGKLLNDFGIEGAQLRKAVLVFDDCIAYSDFQDEKCTAVHELMDRLDVNLFVVSRDGSRVQKCR